VNGTQQLVGLGGMGLIAVNFWTGEQRGQIVPAITGSGNVANAHGAFKEVGAELLFVIIATVLAGLGGGWGTGMVAVIVALFILWGITHYGKASSTTTTPARPASTSGPASTMTATAT
jgi:hypothetical protein